MEHRPLVDPGPQDPSVLTLHRDHRSHYIWSGAEVSLLTPRRADSGLSQVIDRRLVDRLVSAGFYGVYKIGMIKYDCGLIRALVERWRQETHTFHLPIGEASITLQDIGVLSGLPIDGAAVIGVEFSQSPESWAIMCEELLGIRPPTSQIVGGAIKTKWLMTAFDYTHIPDDATEDMLNQIARAYMLALIGGTVLADTSGNRVKLVYLDLLRDMAAINSYSWGGAALAVLYRSMCHVTRPTKQTLGGFLTILQIWAWERLTCVRSKVVKPAEDENDVGLPQVPLGCRWRGAQCFENIVAHNLLPYRDQLDRLTEDQFLWQPYLEQLDTLPEYCRQGRLVWMTRAPLICYDIVEWHLPDRVMRQFGLLQTIPDPCNTNVELHHIDRRGHPSLAWRAVHQDWIALWDARLQSVIGGGLGIEVMDFSHPYMVWYRSITRVLIGNPSHIVEHGYRSHASTFEGMVQLLHRMHDRLSVGLQTDDSSTASTVVMLWIKFDQD